MSFTYDFENMASNPIAQVRFATGLTVDDGAMEDEVITFLLTNNTDSVTKTVVDVLKNLVVQAAQEIDKDTGEVSEATSKRYEQLKSLLHDAMIVDGMDTPVCMHFGGLDSVEFEARNNDASVYQGAITESRSISSTDANEGVLNNCIDEPVTILPEEVE